MLCYVKEILVFIGESGPIGSDQNRQKNRQNCYKPTYLVLNHLSYVIFHLSFYHLSSVFCILYNLFLPNLAKFTQFQPILDQFGQF